MCVCVCPSVRLFEWALIGLIVHIVARDGPDGVLNVRVIIRHLTDAQLLSASRRVRASVTARR